MTVFYEWIKSGSKKIPFRLYLPDKLLFFATALYSRHNQKGKEVSLITAAPNKFVSSIHHNMPVIVQANEIENFFNKPVEENIACAVPCPIQ